MDNQFTRSNLRHQTRLACGLIPLLNLLMQRGVRAEEVLSAVGIRKMELIDPAFTISIEQELKIVEEALQYLPEPSASLELAAHYHLHNFSVLGLAMRSCESLSAVFDLILRYPRLVWGICQTDSDMQGDLIRFQLKAGKTRAERFLLERDMACIKTICSEALSGELQLVSVCFSHEGSADVAEYEDFFNCPVMFGQPHSELKFPISELDRKVPTSDPLSREFYEAQCARISAEIDEPFRYSTLVRDHLTAVSPIPGLDELAAKLEFETRTLQRLLKNEGTTFSEILRDVRFKRAADSLLYTNQTAEEIAYELGFNDAVAFSHAFKTWVGASPRQWLKSHRHSDVVVQSGGIH